MNKSKRTRSIEPLVSDPASYRLSDAQLAAVESRVSYTLSQENQARLSLVRRVGLDAAARAEKYIGQTATGEDRIARYNEIARAFDSKVFLDASARADGGRPPRSVAEGAAGGANAQTPTSNTGVTDLDQHTQDWQTADPITLVIGSGKKAKLLEVPQRRGHNGAAAFPDWIHLTIGKETCDQYADFLGSDEDRVLILSYRLERIFGFGITTKHKNGRNFYAESFGMGNEKEQWGYVCIGGQEETILIGLTGTGLAAAKPGWETRLVHWLEVEAERPKLTRVDLAYDDFTAQHWNVEESEYQYHEGGFQCYHGTAPDAERIGVDWIRLEKQAAQWVKAVNEQAAGIGPVRPDDVPKGPAFKRRGRTFAVGRRASGKYFRCYEKGRQLGDPMSNWVRIEVEFKAVERVLPFDMLLQPGKYLAGAYPCLNWISETQDRVQTHKKALEITLESSIQFVHKQAGQHINVLLEALGVDGFVEKVRREGIPKRFKVADLETAPNSIRISDRLNGLESNELNVLLDMHIQGQKVPAAFFGHRGASPSYRPN